VSTARSRSQNRPTQGEDRPYLLVGLTGGIGSGKSSAAAEFSRLGRRVLPADAIGRELTATDPAVAEEIRRAFGAQAFLGDGSLDRPGLARIAFADDEKLERLNGIIHPRVFRAIEQTLARTPVAELSPYTIIEAAIIFESGMDERLDYVILIDAPEDLRISRVVGRGGMTSEDVRTRMRHQLPSADAREEADFVIENVGTLGDLGLRVEFLDTLLRAMAPTQ
jgi:dephospho-CoA kinase